MYICDSHVHSKFSFDADKKGGGELDALAASAIERGLDEICITDHYDINGIIEGLYEPYDAETARAAVRAAKDKYKSKLRITYGIELGEPVQYPREAAEFLREYNFEFVIGSLHNIRNVPDFCFINFSEMTDRHIETLWERYLYELAELAEFDGISTLAHLTYPVRYINKCGRKLDITRRQAQIEAIFKKIIGRGVALELNTSGLRQGMGTTMPPVGIAELYYECGGRLVTCGSDAHTAGDIGAGIVETYHRLADAGFKEITVFHEGKPYTNSIMEETK